jgi:hypothetical protein
MEEVDDTGFEDFSVSTALENVSFSVEQTIDKWLHALAKGLELTGLCQPDPSAPLQSTAVEGRETSSC